MNDITKKVLIVSGIFIGGAAIGRYSLPAKVVEKEKIVYQDRIVEKTVEVKDTKKKDNKVYTRTEKTTPDGTKTVETKITDNDVSETADNTKLNKAQDTTTTTDKEKTVTYNNQSTLISVGAKMDTANSTAGVTYGLFVSERVIGPLYMGVFGFTDRSFGISAGVTF